MMLSLSIGLTSSAALAALFAVAPGFVSAQSRPAACLSLRGSTQCPAFQDAYINPQNLTQAWPWMSAVTDVASFDTQFALYWTEPDRFEMAKIHGGLQCNRTGSSNVQLQWQRTVYCSQFTRISYSASCNVGVTSPMVCQSTCTEYSNSQQTIVDNPQICAPSSALSAARNETRARTLTKDYTQCTNWQSLASNNTATCVEGAVNEGNCGYGPTVSAQLCGSCDPTGNSTVAPCCTASNTDLSQCASFGFPAAARIRPDSTSSSSISSSTSTGAPAATNGSSDAQNESTGVGSTNLSRGQLAGIIVGCIVGALLLGILLALLIFGRRKRKNGQANRGGGGVYAGGVPASARPSTAEKPWNSEDHMPQRKFADSPETGKAALGGAGGSSGHQAINMAAFGAGAGAAAAGGAAVAARSRAESPANNRPNSAALTSSSGGEKGVTVPTVRDQYTGQDIHVGEDVMAIYPYNASLNDELTLEPEQKVTILRLYDDGWALGRTPDGQEGALPLVCVSSTKGDLPGRRNPGASGTGTSEDDGMTSGAEYTSSVDGAVTAEEGGFTSDGRSQRAVTAEEGGFTSDARSNRSRR